MKKTIILFVAMALFAFTNAQNPDTLIIKIENYAELRVFSPDIVKNTIDIDTAFSKFYSLFKTIDTEKYTEGNYKITYDNFGKELREIVFEKTNSFYETTYFGNEKTAVSSNYKYVLFISPIKFAGFHFEIAVNNLKDFEKVSEIDLNKLLYQASKDLKESDFSKRSAIFAIYNSKNDILNTENKIAEQIKGQDFLSISPNLGVLLINSQLIPEINLEMNMVLSTKGTAKNIIGISYNTYFFPNNSNLWKPDLYSFLTLKYKRTTESASKTGFGISAGYLMSGIGNYFPENTWKFGMDLTPGKFSGSLQLFTSKTGDKRNWLPAIGFGFTF